MDLTHRPASAPLALLEELHLNLKSNLAAAEADARQAKESVAQLQYSTNLVSKMLGVMSSGALSPVTYPLLENFQVSGQMANEASARFARAPAGAERSFYASQIQTTLTSAASAYVAALPESDRIPAEPVAAELRDHREALLTLEQRLAERLKAHRPHLPAMLAGALESYRDATNPLRYANAATNLRELHREFLAEVAPDKAVKAARGFVPDPTSRSGVTRKHRIGYAIYGGLPRELFPEEFAETADELADELGDDIDRLSAFTHVTADVLAKRESDAAPVLSAIMQRFIQLIEAIGTGKRLALETLTLIIQDQLDRVFRDDFFDELDILSSHTRPHDAEDVEVKIDSIDEESIYFSGAGSIRCELQYGSDSDVEKDDGFVSKDSFPFKFSGRTPVDDPEAVEIDRESIEIDTSSFYE